METSKYEKLNQSGSGAGETRDILREPREQAQQQNFSSSALGPSRSLFTLHVFLGDNGYGAKELETAVPERLTEAQRLLRALYARWEELGVSLRFHKLSELIDEGSLSDGRLLQERLKKALDFENGMGPLLLCADAQTQRLALALCEQWQARHSKDQRFSADNGAFLFGLTLHQKRDAKEPTPLSRVLEHASFPCIHGPAVPCAYYELGGAPKKNCTDGLLSKVATTPAAALEIISWPLYACLDGIEGAIATVHYGVERQATYRDKRCEGFYAKQPLLLGPSRGAQRTPLFIDVFEAQANASPDKMAVWTERKCVSFGQLDGWANAAARDLLVGVAESPRAFDGGRTPVVGLYFERSIEAVVALLGVLKAGMAFSFLAVPETDLSGSGRFSTGVDGFESTLKTVEAVCPDYLLYSASRVFPEGLKEALSFPCVPMETSAALEAAPKSPLPVSQDSAAYVAHSSGSSGGLPKVATMRHRGLYNLLAELRDVMHIGPDSVVAHESHLQFDAALTEILVPLMAGGALVIVPAAKRLGGARVHSAYYNPEAKAQEYCHPAPTAAFWIPAVVKKMELKSSFYPHLTTILFTGESLPKDLAREWRGLSARKEGEATGHRIIVNGYGPMEVTIGATVGVYRPKMEEMPIGEPVRGLGVLLAEHPSLNALSVSERMDEEPTEAACFPDELRLVKAGTEGEMYIYGPGLGEYGNRWDMSPEDLKRFRLVTVITEEGLSRKVAIFQTGDRGRWAGGQLYCHGRIDGTRQGKWNSVMVTSLEIEACLNSHELVAQSYVDLSGLAEAKRCIKAYLLPKPVDKCSEWAHRHGVDFSVSGSPREWSDVRLRAPLLADVFQWGRRKVARWATIKCPTHYALLETWPLLPSGKTNKRALKAIACHRPPALPSEEPLTEVEQMVVSCFECICLEEQERGGSLVGRHTDFYSLGGDSLEAVQLKKMLEDEMKKQLKEAGKRLSPTGDPQQRYLTPYTTVKGIATQFTLQKSLLLGEPQEWLMMIRAGAKENYKCPAFLIHPLTGEVDCYQSPDIPWAKDRALYGIQAPGLDNNAYYLDDIPTMAAAYRQVIQRCAPQGPYLLGGFSLGGVIAYEIACQLKEAGEAVHVFAIDSRSPMHYGCIDRKETGVVLAFLNKELSKKNWRPVQGKIDYNAPTRESMIHGFMESVDEQCEALKEIALRQKAQAYCRQLRGTLAGILSYRPTLREDVSLRLLGCKDSDRQYGAALGWGKEDWVSYEACLSGGHLDCLRENTNRKTIAEEYAKDCDRYERLLKDQQHWEQGEAGLGHLFSECTGALTPEKAMDICLREYGNMSEGHPAEISGGEQLIVAKLLLEQFAGQVALAGLLSKTPFSGEKVVAIGECAQRDRFPSLKKAWLTSGVLALALAPRNYAGRLLDCRFVLAKTYVKAQMAQSQEGFICEGEGEGVEVPYFSETAGGWHLKTFSLASLEKALSRARDAANTADEVAGYVDLVNAVTEKRKASVESQVRQHLRNLYQQEAQYLPAIGEAGVREAPWPIIHTYRQLVMQVSKLDWVLYTIRDIRPCQLPALTSALYDHALILTASGVAYMQRHRQWACGEDENMPLAISPVIHKAGLKALGITNEELTVAPFSSSDTRRLIEAIEAGYAEQLKGKNSLSQESVVERHNTVPITEMDLFKPSGAAQVREKGQAPRLQRVLVTGDAGVGKSTLLQYLAYRWGLSAPEAGAPPLWQPGELNGYSLVFWLPLKQLHDPRTVADDRTLLVFSGRGEEGLPSERRLRFLRLAHFINRVCGFDRFKGEGPSINSLATLLEKRISQTLLLVDSFDEVAHFYTGNRAGMAAEKALLEAVFAWDGPILLTTRPYGQNALPSQWSPERCVVNTGFSAKSVQAFVHHYFAEHPPRAVTRMTPGEAAASLLQLIGSQGERLRISRIPLMTRLLCFHWQWATPIQQHQANDPAVPLTLTAVMGFFLQSFLQRANSKEAQAETTSAPWRDLSNEEVLASHSKGVYDHQCRQLAHRHSCPLGLLTELAYEGLKDGQQLVIDIASHLKVIEGHYNALPQTLKQNAYGTEEALFQAALSLGLLRKTKDGHGGKALYQRHQFIHLLFQEYLAARYIHEHLQDEEVQTFIKAKRYEPVYEKVWAFTAGLADGDELTLKPLWHCLMGSPQSWSGLREARIGSLCLAEWGENTGPYAVQAIEMNRYWLAELVVHDGHELSPYKRTAIETALLPAWRGLSTSAGEQLLAPWHRELYPLSESCLNEPLMEATLFFQLWEVLSELKGVLLDWLPTDFVKIWTHQLCHSHGWRRHRAKQVLKALGDALIEPTGEYLSLILKPLEGDCFEAQEDMLRVLRGFDKSRLSQNEGFMACLVGYLKPQYHHSNRTRCTVLRLVEELGPSALAHDSLYKAVKESWWSWSSEIHESATKILAAYEGERQAEALHMAYGLIMALNECAGGKKSANNRTYRQAVLPLWRFASSFIWGHPGAKAEFVWALDCDHDYYGFWGAWRALGTLDAATVLEDKALKQAVLNGLKKITPSFKRPLLLKPMLVALEVLGRSIMQENAALLTEVFLNSLRSTERKARKAALGTLKTWAAQVSLPEATWRSDYDTYLKTKPEKAEERRRGLWFLALGNISSARCPLPIATASLDDEENPATWDIRYALFLMSTDGVQWMAQQDAFWDTLLKSLQAPQGAIREQACYVLRQLPEKGVEPHAMPLSLRARVRSGLLKGFSEDEAPDVTSEPPHGKKIHTVCGIPKPAEKTLAIAHVRRERWFALLQWAPTALLGDRALWRILLEDAEGSGRPLYEELKPFFVGLSKKITVGQLEQDDALWEVLLDALNREWRWISPLKLLQQLDGFDMFEKRGSLQQALWAGLDLGKVELTFCGGLLKSIYNLSADNQRRIAGYEEFYKALTTLLNAPCFSREEVRFRGEVMKCFSCFDPQRGLSHDPLHRILKTELESSHLELFEAALHVLEAWGPEALRDDNICTVFIENLGEDKVNSIMYANTLKVLNAWGVRVVQDPAFPPLRQRLLDHLNNAQLSEGVRADTLAVLGSWGPMVFEDPDIYQLLLSYLRAASERLREKALEVAAQWGPMGLSCEDLVMEVLRHLREEKADTHLYSQALSVVKAWGVSEAFTTWPALQKACRRGLLAEDKHIRERLWRTMFDGLAASAYWDKESALAYLGLHDPQSVQLDRPTDNGTIKDVIGSLEAPRATSLREILLQSLDAKEEELRKVALWALPQLGETKVLEDRDLREALLTNLRTPEQKLRDVALSVLASLGPVICQDVSFYTEWVNAFELESTVHWRSEKWTVLSKMPPKLVLQRAELEDLLVSGLLGSETYSYACKALEDLGIEVIIGSEKLQRALFETFNTTKNHEVYIRVCSSLSRLKTASIFSDTALAQSVKNRLKEARTQEDFQKALAGVMVLNKATLLRDEVLWDGLLQSLGGAAGDLWYSLSHFGHLVWKNETLRKKLLTVLTNDSYMEHFYRNYYFHTFRSGLFMIGPIPCLLELGSLCITEPPLRALFMKTLTQWGEAYSKSGSSDYKLRPQGALAHHPLFCQRLLEGLEAPLVLSSCEIKAILVRYFAPSFAKESCLDVILAIVMRLKYDNHTFEPSSFKEAIGKLLHAGLQGEHYWIFSQMIGVVHKIPAVHEPMATIGYKYLKQVVGNDDFLNHCIPYLQQHLFSTEYDRTAMALDVLTVMGEEILHYPVLFSGLKDLLHPTPWPGLQSRALAVAGAIGDPILEDHEVTDLFIGCLRSADSRVRGAALKALGGFSASALRRPLNRSAELPYANEQFASVAIAINTIVEGLSKQEKLDESDIDKLLRVTASGTSTHRKILDKEITQLPMETWVDWVLQCLQRLGDSRAGLSAAEKSRAYDHMQTSCLERPHGLFYLLHRLQPKEDQKKSLEMWYWTALDKLITPDTLAHLLKEFNGCIQNDGRDIQKTYPSVILWSLNFVYCPVRIPGPPRHTDNEQDDKIIIYGKERLEIELTYEALGSFWKAHKASKGCEETEKAQFLLRIMAWGGVNDCRWSLLLEKERVEDVTQKQFLCYRTNSGLGRGRLFAAPELLCPEADADSEHAWHAALGLHENEAYYTLSALYLSGAQAEALKEKLGTLTIDPLMGPRNSLLASPAHGLRVYGALKGLLMTLGKCEEIEKEWPKTCEAFFNGEGGHRKASKAVDGEAAGEDNAHPSKDNCVVM